jgi:hypothetical protein
VSDELAEFLEAYDSYRVADQAGFYDERSEEYRTAAGQLGWANETCLFVAASCGVLAAVFTQHATWLGVVAAGFAAIGASLTSWADVVGFAANAELYRAARAGLGRLRPERPTADAPADQVNDYIANVEEILLGEVLSWSEKWGGAGGDDA